MFSHSAKGAMIDLIDVAMGEKHAAGQPIVVYLREANGGHRLTLVDAECPVIQAFNMDWASGKQNQSLGN